MQSVKRKVIDYTDQKPETKTGEDSIQVCSKCKKTGLAITAYQQTVILHAIWFVSNEDGTFEIEDEAHINPASVPKS